MERENESSHIFAVLDHMPMGVFALDRQYTVLFWNRRLEEWTGIKREVLLHKVITEEYPQLDDPKYTLRINGVFDGGPPVIFSSQLHGQIIPAYMSNGELRLQHTTVIPIATDVDDQFYAMFAIQDVTDVTLRMRETRLARDQALAEVHERERAEARLRDSESELRALFAAMQNLIMIMDRDGVYKRIITSGDFKIDETSTFIGHSLVEYSPEYEAQQALAKIEQCLKTGDTTEMEYRVRLGETRWMWLQASFSPLNDNEVICVIADITQRKQAQDNEMALAIEQEKVRVLSSFIQSASHDFRTALSVMNTSLYLMGKAKSDEQREQRIDRIKEQISHLQVLVDSLFTIYRWDTLENNLKYSKVYLQTIMNNLRANFSHRVQGTPVSIEFMPVAFEMPIYVDEIELTHALGFLIDNAIQFTTQGHISVRAYYANERVHFEVKDTGLGIEEADLINIFDMFYKADKARSRQGGGLGLGLSMAQRIARAHNGHIHVESTPGKGSTFTLIFPDEIPPLV